MNSIETKWMQLHDTHLQKWKLRFVRRFHKKCPGKYCWADCVSWAFDWRKFNPFKIEKSTGCKNESEKYNYSCYCGEWSNGKCWNLLSEKEREYLIEKRGKEHADAVREGDYPF